MSTINAFENDLTPPAENSRPTETPREEPSKARPTSTKRKRPFKGKRVPPTQGKNTAANFDKSKVAKLVVFTSPILTAFELDTSYRGVLNLCSILFSILSNRDQKITTLLTAHHFQYVTLLCTLYRANLIAQNSTTTMIRNLSYLRDTVKQLLLPDILCQYVEAIGHIKLSSGITVIPYMRSYEEMKANSLDFIDPASILAQMHRPVPDTDWAIDDEVVLKYKSATSRVLKNVFKLRIVNNDILEAKPEFLGCYETLRDRRVLPLAFEQMNAAECMHGAVMMYRDVNTQRFWQGSYKPPVVHETQPVSCDSYITDYILHHLNGEQK